MEIGAGARFAPMLACVLVLAGCMSSGTQVSDDEISQFVRGKTTEAEIIARLGPPTSTERSASGLHVDMYTYTKAAANAQSFIPIVGTFVASTDVKTQIVRFTFSPRNVLVDWTSSGSSSTINSGLANQK